MISKIIGACIVIVSCLLMCGVTWHLVDKLKTPKNERIWWGTDVALQMIGYPTCIYGILIGIYQFMV